MNYIKNIIIGIDGGCFDHINPLLEKGLLPNFEKMIKNGFKSTLDVPIPPITIPSWPCLFSGASPNQLEYNYFIHPKKGIFNSYRWRDKSLFSLTSLPKTFVLNIPGSYPAWEINGEMITGMLSPKLSYFPEDLDFFSKNNWIIDGKTIPEVFKAFAIKKELFLQKLNEDFELQVFVIRLPDLCSHISIPKTSHNVMKNIYLSYIKIDDFLKQLLDHENIDNVFIFSDHGLNQYKRVFFFNKWLEKKKLIYINDRKYMENGLIKTILMKIYGPFREFVNFEDIFKKFVERKFQKKQKEKIRYLDKPTIKFIDQYVSNVGNIVLHGKQKLKRDKIEKFLLKEKIIKRIIKDNFENFPDFYIILDDEYLFTGEPCYFTKMKTDYIAHSVYGLFLAYGKDVKEGSQDSVNYLDVLPSILDLLNIEKPPHMMGEPLKIFRDELYKDRPEKKKAKIKILEEKEEIGKAIGKIKFDKI